MTFGYRLLRVCDLRAPISGIFEEVSGVAVGVCTTNVE
jgi:hypothetical protein